ncbi:7-keto-8-aminopelargonate synthetase-like enzyme [Xenococcus sp. PCC 7305]|uniref:bifunctional aminotransferase class I/II-fold pyridoxal phosphate-dependent enzyme/GNAT family N-acetyltransferase n=1 Tax=Xenococcus sp. PCC 7305 TaxID=102125 RepID=UPI0002ABFF31|nr:bifunctional aminotransferase class I/II-fold pyridoxal phosphate-dependent enzyme/GNAT family N-acetyltransferase [Xenococcus sp. PCC 7305]ELS01022.1 7-keto-8-aminopelargonate synthetase-like enzyme [Xenococcus sp. PCC 7305]
MPKNLHAHWVKTIDKLVENGIKQGLNQHFTDNEFLNGRIITLQDRNYVNFGSCSYLGLEQHHKLIDGVTDAVRKYGTQFSSSRAYVAVGLYQELETLLQEIFDKPVVVTASTTLGHLSALPILIGDNDCILLDYQVHSSVQMAAQVPKARGVDVEILRHNSMTQLEETIKKIKHKYDKIWYLADGIYSMYGDVAPLPELVRLLDTYPQLYAYIDDAHGMSWTGKNGRGYVRSQIDHHSKMVLAVSLNKSFASAGGALVFPNETFTSQVKNCGNTMIFSGPIQPPMLGGGVASAKLHLSEEIVDYQNELKELIKYTNQCITELNIPQVEINDNPIFFIPVGLVKPIQSFVSRIIKDGFFVNPAAFPATPMKQGGIRFSLTRHILKRDIEQLLERIAFHYPVVLQEHNFTEQDVAKNFQIPEFQIQSSQEKFGFVSLKNHSSSKLDIQFTRRLKDINAQEWDNLFATKGNFTYSSIELLEKVFTSQDNEPENQWDFFYFIVKDEADKIVLATFYTCAKIKEDMFSSQEVSKKVEAMRLDDPDYLTGKAVMLGCLMSKGEHLYLNRQHSRWKQALRLLVEQISLTVQEYQASQVLLRDFPLNDDEELKNTMFDLGFVQLPLLDICIMQDLSWSTHQEYMTRLGRKYRYNVKKEILAYESQFEVIIDSEMSPREIRHSYELYRQVQQRAYELNVYPLPYAFFEAICHHPDYDIMRLYLKDDPASRAEEKPVAVMFSFVNAGVYSALIVGLDYQYLRTHNIYKQILYQTVQRSRELECQTLDLAYTAVLEKKKVGARPHPMCAYVQSLDRYSQAVLDAMVV